MAQAGADLWSLLVGSPCRSTTPGSVQSPRCCGPSAGARQSHACSEQLAAPKVSPPPPLRAHREQRVLVRASSGAMCRPAPAHSPSPAGTCLRLYSEAFYEQRLPPSPAPHVSETSLSRLVLLLKRLDIADMGQCDFLDRPGGAETECGGAGRRTRASCGPRSLQIGWKRPQQRGARPRWRCQPSDLPPQPPSR